MSGSSLIAIDKAINSVPSSCALWKGIISALAFSYSPEYYAAGSFTPATLVSDNIALFNESVSEPVLLVGGVAEWEKGGVTQVSIFNHIASTPTLKSQSRVHGS